MAPTRLGQPLSRPAGGAGHSTRLLARRPARLVCCFEPTASGCLRHYRRSGRAARGRHATRRISALLARPAVQAGLLGRADGGLPGLAALDLLDHTAAELAPDEFHAGQAVRGGRAATGLTRVIRPLLIRGRARLP